MSNTSDGAVPQAPGGDGFMVVGLGASAGGIRALREFFGYVPERSGMAYVVILHLSPDHDSQLAEVLQQSTPLPVKQVTERVEIEPDHVYVIPPNKSLSLEDGSLVLSEVTSVEERRAPVDIFFRTLAESHGMRAGCVVLSGTGANGSMGLKRVKERGGVAVVARAEGGRVRGHAAPLHRDGAGGLRAAGRRDAGAPRRLPRQPARRRQGRDRGGGAGARATGPRSRRSPPSSRSSGCAPGTTSRTTSAAPCAAASSGASASRRRPTSPPTPATSARTREEARALLKDLLISVTNFFRDPEAFEALEASVIPRLFEDKGAGGYVRVWVAGCATGEEAYSIAMLLAEYAETLAARAVHPGLRLRHRRGGHPDGARRPLHPERRGRREPRAAAPLLHERARRLRRPPRVARDGALRQARPAQRPALLAPRPGKLPQPPHLLQRRGAGEGDVPLPLRPEPRRPPLPRRLRDDRRPLRPLRVRGQAEPHLPVEGGRAAPRPGRAAARAHPDCRPGADPPGGDGADGARTGAALLPRTAPAAAGAVRAALGARQRRARDRPPLGVGRPLPGDARRRAHATTCSRSRAPSCGWSCAARSSTPRSTARTSRRRGSRCASATAPRRSTSSSAPS